MRSLIPGFLVHRHRFKAGCSFVFLHPIRDAPPKRPSNKKFRGRDVPKWRCRFLGI
jgi:hypothetical protein